ncbi:hypothetical protein GCM10028784_24280 [Myceligenerans cantabricum]
MVDPEPAPGGTPPPQQQYQQPSPYEQPPQPVYVYPRPPKNDLAILSLIFGCIGVAAGFGPLAGVPAVILGHQARRAVAAAQADNGTLATAGIVLGWVSIAFGILVALAFVAYLMFFGIFAFWMTGYPSSPGPMLESGTV